MLFYTGLFGGLLILAIAFHAIPFIEFVRVRMLSYVLWFVGVAVWWWVFKRG